MTTPDEFLPRVLAAVDDAALRLAGTPHELQAAFLQRLACRIRAQWRELFTPALSAEDVDGMVADVVARIRAKRDSLESFGGGRA
jgi:hypothetical protein